MQPTGPAIAVPGQSFRAESKTRRVGRHYFLVGGVWLLPNTLQTNTAPTLTELHGSTGPVNSTMETFG
jgi:hypothetical protein